MDDTRARLGKCFTAVFADLKLGEIEGATPVSVKGWDSLASLTLLTVIGEEFNIDIDFADLPEDLSYQRIAEYIEKRTGASNRVG